MKKNGLFSLLGLSIFLLTVASANAQPAGRSLQEKTSHHYDCEEDWLEVMFSWESMVRFRSGSLIDLSTNALQGTENILDQLAWHQWHRLSDVPEAMIDGWESTGERNTGQDLYNLNNIYRLQIPKGYDIWKLSEQLESLPGIYLARPVPKPVIPPSPLPPPGSFQSQQGYLNHSSNNPSGVDAIYAWTQSGGTGAGITICDLEYSWNYNHADITKAVGSQINPNPITDPFSNTNHGTAVIGELVADNNGWGTTGICYGAGLKTCGTYYTAGGGWNVAGAISYAIANLSAGDIILLEQQWEYTSGAQNFIPIEWWQNYSNSAQTNNAVYAAIVTAVANGIHVVEAGGNGNVNTGTLTWYGDSGAIIVGAGGATTTNDRQRLSFSSYGPRFNLQGWGENIVTTGGSYYGPDLYSAEGVNYYYTNTFNGTSGASPIVAGALACTQGYYVTTYGAAPASPSYMRSHLATWGTAQVYGPSGNIGPRPNIKAAIQNLQPPQIYYDWGDAPDLPYPTLSSNNGAYHRIDGVTYLGITVDAENNGQPNANATGDDINGSNDDDGVVFTSLLIPGQNANVQVTASVAGVLNAWIDFNGLNVWSDPGEFIFQNTPLTAGVNNLTFFVPANAMTGNAIARFRFNSTGGILFYGNGLSGEVEDYQVFISGGEDGLDWGDAPDAPYPTLQINNGARHQIIPGIMLGSAIDSEPNGQPDPLCMGDDNDLLYPPPNDDEDGVVFPGPIVPGQPAMVNVTVSSQGFLNAWFDFNNNGSWLDPGEQVFQDILIPSGLNPLIIPIPPTAIPGQVYARFRFCTGQGLSFNGYAPDGEVEDYVVTILQQTEEYDWGDAPDGPFPTLGTSNGARHMIVPGFMLGNSVDQEPDGQPEPMALGDDNDILYPPVNDDEDGVVFTTALIPGQNATVNINASAMGALNAWLDFNINGSWADPGEQIFTDVMLNPGINALSFTVPASAAVGQTFARFRFSNMTGLTFTGAAPDGEIEDYQVNVGQQTPDSDWGDAPDGPYPTLGVSNGASHLIIPGFMLGNSIDAEPDGQPEPMALGDDNDILYPPVNDDEDGVVFTSPLISGQNATLNVTASVNGMLNAWIDFNMNGTWIDPGEHICIDLILNPGANPLSFPVPSALAAGQTFARFRFSSLAGLSFTGMAPDGEVEDYFVTIEPQPDEFDWGDAPDGPYPTLGVSNGASHLIIPGFMLGNSIDPEPDGQPEPMALGDDNDILYPPVNDDEDGVVFTSALIPGQNATVNINASAIGALNAWLDFNINGSWADPGEQIFTDVMLNPGINALSFTVPASATAGQSFARFRFSNMLGLTFTGIAPDGEVEDYFATIEPLQEEFDWGDAPDGPYPTLGINNGANHRLDGVTFLGLAVDAEPDGQPDPLALGDDNNNVMDEDGVQFNWPLLKGSPAIITVTASTSGLFNGWIDFNRDGSWAQPNEHVFVDFFLTAGIHQLNLIVPPNSMPGTSLARFRFSTQAGLSYSGQAPDGEVEDYMVMIEANPELKWNQQPDANQTGLHAHDYLNVYGSHEWITIADDWLCNGGRVTDINWWGNYELNAALQEKRGAGISHFHLSIHNDDPSGTCLPSDPEIWGMDVPFSSITEQFTGMTSADGSPVYHYSFVLPQPFAQIEGNRYWLDITAFSVNPSNHAFWRWQEACRSSLPILCGAADKVSPSPALWSTIFWQTTGLYSDMAFAITNVPDKTLNLKFFLEGLYAGSSTMNKAQDANGNHFAADTADVVTVELHDAADYSNIIWTKTNIAVNTGGQAVVGQIPYTLSGSYYVTIKHRNSIETTTANPVSFAGNYVSYDFSTAASQAYGSNQQIFGGVYAFYGGDVNQDGSVDTGDMTPVDNDALNFATGYLNTDVNGDGTVDTGDMTIIDNNNAAFVGSITP